MHGARDKEGYDHTAEKRERANVDQDRSFLCQLNLTNRNGIAETSKTMKSIS